MVTDITEIVNLATFNKQNKAVFLATAQQTVLPRVRVNTWDGLQLAAQHSGNLKMVRSHRPYSSWCTVVLLGEKRSDWKTNRSFATLSTTNPSRTGVGSNPGLGGERPASSRIYPAVQKALLYSDGVC